MSSGSTLGSLAATIPWIQAVELGQVLLQPLVDVGQERWAGIAPPHRLELFGRVLDLHRTLNELEARLDHLELAGHQLLRLDQDVLAHADLAEVVQQARVAQLLELVLGEVDVPILADLDPRDLAGQAGGQAFDATRVTGGARVSLLDRGHAGLDEPVEQGLDRVEQVLVVDGDSGLAGDRLDHLEVLGPEADHLVRHVGDRQPGLEAALGVDQLDRADDLVVVVAHRHGEHRLGPVAVLRVEALAALRLARRRVVGVVVDLARRRR